MFCKIKGVINYMKKRIFTGNYEECKIGNLISISGDRGKSVGFTGKSIPQLSFGKYGIIT